MHADNYPTIIACCRAGSGACSPTSGNALAANPIHRPGRRPEPAWDLRLVLPDCYALSPVAW